jgi:predicted LPLAT superfamily acyltransferase
LVINRYFSLGGWLFFQILRQPFFLIFSYKNGNQYQIAVSDFGFFLVGEFQEWTVHKPA